MYSKTSENRKSLLKSQETLSQSFLYQAMINGQILSEMCSHIDLDAHLAPSSETAAVLGVHTGIFLAPLIL